MTCFNVTQTILYYNYERMESSSIIVFMRPEIPGETHLEFLDVVPGLQPPPGLDRHTV